MRGLALVIQFLAQPSGDLGMDVAGGDRSVVALVETHCEAQLPQIGLHRRTHIRVLQFAGEKHAIQRCRAMHLAQRGGAGGGVLEGLEAALPVRAEFALHATAHKRPAHRRRIGLQLDQLADIFFGERLGDRREELRHLHQGALDAAERRTKIGGVALAVDRHPQIAFAGEARAESGHRAANPRVAAHPAGETVFVAHR